MKKTFKIAIVVIILLIIILKLLSLLGIFKHANAENATLQHNPNACVGLNYHRIHKPTLYNKLVEKFTSADELTDYTVYTDDFEEQLKMLKKMDVTFVNPYQIEEYQKKGSFPKKCVWLSFDDGDRTIYDNAFPILKKEHIPFTMYLIAGRVGDKDFQNLTLSNWTDIKKMMDSHLVTIGSHTYDMHRLDSSYAPVFFSKSEEKAFKEDLVKSRATIKKHLGIDTTIFAYPYGNTNDNLIQIVKDSGFSQAAILAPNTIKPTDNPFIINRIVVHSDTIDKSIVPWLKNQDK